MKKNNEFEINELSQATKVSMRTRIISAIVACIIIFPLLFLGDWFFFALIAFVAVVAAIEIVNCAKPRHSSWLYIGTIVLILFLTFWPVLRQLFFALFKSAGWKLWTSFETIYISVIVLVASIFLSFMFVVIDKDTTVGDASFIFTTSIIVSLGLQACLFLRYYPIIDVYGYVSGDALPDVGYFNFFENFSSSMLLCFVGLATFMTDIGAYFTGVLFGKHKMNERISPKKTWEGFVGGVVMSFVFGFSFAFFMALGGHPILSILDINHWYYILILCLAIPFISTLGDFVFSSFKRYYGIKDFGKIMPGHGGALDRIDSLVFSMIFSALFICIIAGREIPLL